MAATQADLSRLDAILKDRPLVDSIQEAINKSTPLAEKFTQQLTLSGRKGIFPVQFGVNEGIYARADKGTFGDSQVDQPVLAEITAKFVYALFDISGPTMSATRDTPGAFEEALALQLENTIDGVKLDMARMILGDGSGTIGLVQSRTDADEFVMDSPFGLTTYKSNVPVRNIIRKNMSITIIDTDGSTYNTGSASVGARVESVTHSATGTAIDVDTAETNAAADGDFVTRHANRNLEPVGFFGAVATSGNYLNISRTGQPNWQGVITDAAGGGGSTVALDPDMLRDEMDAIMEATGLTPDVIVCNFKQRRNIFNLYAPQIRYAPMVLPAGMREGTLAFDDIPILAERFFPPQHIGFVSTKTWYHAIDKDVEWIQGLNGTVLHFKGTQDVWFAVLRTYRNFACLYPAANGYVYGLTE